MGFGIIIIGDEILSGRRTDKHLSKVIALLEARGLALDWAEYVGDNRARITATLKRTFSGDDIVFSTGGIGATPDDHTRQCAAAALGVPITLHSEAKALIIERIRVMKEGVVDLTLPENTKAAKLRQKYQAPDGSVDVDRIPLDELPQRSAAHGDTVFNCYLGSLGSVSTSQPRYCYLAVIYEQIDEVLPKEFPLAEKEAISETNLLPEYPDEDVIIQDSQPAPQLIIREHQTYLRSRPGLLYFTAMGRFNYLWLGCWFDSNVYEVAMIEEWVDEFAAATKFYLGDRKPISTFTQAHL